MKLKSKTLNIAGAILLAASLTGILSGCDSVIYDDSDCVESYNTVRFEYTYNMKNADAFAQEVKSVTLFFFNSATGKLVRRVDAPREKLKDGNKLDVAVEPGEYDILVWGGDYSGDYTIADGQPGTSVAEDFHCRMNRRESNGVHTSDACLEALYHGMVHVSLPYASPSAPHEVVIPMKKDTNTIRVVLQHVSGEVVSHEDFEFTLTDRNGWLNYDNTLRDAGTTINYLPWRTLTGSVDINTDPNDAPGNVASPAVKTAASRSVLGASLAEFTVNRLMMENNPVLTITNKQTGKTVLSIPVRDYALLVKGFAHEDMDNQEYLDRQDEYNMTFFLTGDKQWLSTVIIINDWRIVRHNVDIE